MTDTGAKPLWRRIADFPLVTLVIAAAIFIGASALAGVIGNQLPQLDSPLREAAKFLIAVGITLAAYKFIIARMGERPKDDLPWRGSAAGFGAGVLIGFLLFSAVVGIAALAGGEMRVSHGATVGGQETLSTTA